MKKIVLFSKSVYDEIPRNYRENLNTFILEVIRESDMVLWKKIKNNERKYEFSDLYFDDDDESIGQDVNQTIRMKFSSAHKEVVDTFCENGKGKIVNIDGVEFKMTTCFDVIRNVNEYAKHINAYQAQVSK